LELLEAEIRQHQDALREAQNKSAELESQLTVARRETELLRTQIAQAGTKAPLPEQTSAIARLAGVKINTLLSGGKDRDGNPGDDVLVALIAPHDEQGDLVKIAGEIEIEAYDLTRTGDDKRVGRWSYSPEQAAQAWHSGFVGAGLQFELPWQVLPSASELVVHARLKTTDGRQFDTNTPLKVNPPQTASAPPAPLNTVPAIQPVKHEQVEAPTRRPLMAQEQESVDQPEMEPEVNSIVRPVPEYEDVPSVSNDPFRSRPFPSAGEQTDREPPARVNLDGVETSDNWTDETIPRLR